jgi:diaminopropionate ammonia-lyase
LPQPAPSENGLFINPRAEAGSADLWGALSAAGSDAAIAEISRWSDYAETPLIALPGQAERRDITSLHYKNEAGRFGLGSFKSLGGAYAVFRLLQCTLRQEGASSEISAADLESGRFRHLTSRMTVCCATDGNHGRSVAWGAQKFHCRCVIYLHRQVSAGREKAIAAYGAEIVRTTGGYDESVRRAAADAARNGWTVVSDTSWPGYETIPGDVMNGYTLMAEEVVRRMKSNPPTHAFVQAGVGGAAAAVCARFAHGFEEARPKFIVVEPARAACLYESARKGRCAAVDIVDETVMACLSAGEPSPLAWSVLERGADAFMILGEELAPEAMRALADGAGDDPPIVAGESGAAGFAALLAASRSPQHSRRLGLGSESRVVLFGTEGATDGQIYARLVGRSAQEVAARCGSKRGG